MTGSRRHEPLFSGLVQLVAAGWATFEHVYPSSNVHVGEHPSEPTRLPSSHSSPTSRAPFPHVTSHARVVAPSRHFGSFEQVVEQPVPSPKKSPFSAPTSQDSPTSRPPLPQTALIPPVPAPPVPVGIPPLAVPPL